VGVLGLFYCKIGPCITINQQYVNPTMLLYHCHMPQCSMVAEQSNNLFPSYHLYSHCACSHCLRMFWYPVKAKQLHALQLSNNMWMQPCCLITGIILHKHSMVVELSAHLLPSHHHQNYCACAHGLWGFWDPVTTKLLPALQFHHTATRTSVPVHMACGGSETLSPQNCSLPCN
jgi:hypothetical protein